MNSPEPTPLAVPLPAMIVTTEGSSRSATAVISQAEPFPVVVALDGELAEVAIIAPATPPTSKTATTAVQRSRRFLPMFQPRSLRFSASDSATLLSGGQAGYRGATVGGGPA